MEELTSIFSGLQTFFDKINITEVWETDESSSIQADDLEPIIDYRVLLFNGYSSNILYKKFDEILKDVHFKLKDNNELKKPNNKINDSYKTVVNELINNIENRSIFKIEFKKGKADEVDWEVIDRHFSPIILALRKQKDYASKTYKPQPFIPQGNKPLRWNENVNKLVDILYQLANEIKTGENETLIETKPLNLAYFIVNNFVDQNGEPINFETVQTCLKPGRVEKRASGINRIIIKYIP